ncbi:hypothetical protein AB7M45_007777 [Bradyrhizobium elkanii]|uniref:hypothetical protein n=1 Tax=Bradyrhizobium elkanii TaxID=29448 RepID=UPI000921CAD0|nr:hypothetical protein [Bradyrhizobium elkanii]MCW2195006.1 hypothetical protein [Bradyrhizobium elkanii]NWL67297.1 hypothetical protein [Bradyrhizobium elkanii]OIM94657.1 hypothetical protein BLN97_09300 [Bradyrhizobium elkanii]
MAFSKYEFRVALWRLIEEHLAKAETAETFVELDEELEVAATKLHRRSDKIPDDDFDNIDIGGE